MSDSEKKAKDDRDPQDKIEDIQDFVTVFTQGTIEAITNPEVWVREIGKAIWNGLFK